jgi:pheromone shutdown protein TraB
MTHCTMVLIEGVILVEKDIFVFSRHVGEVHGVSPGPHTSSAAEAHSYNGMKVLKCDREVL